MRKAGLVEPASRVDTYCIDHEDVIRFPTTHGISVKPGIGKAPRVHLGRVLSAVHPDFPPHALLLKQNQHAIRHRLERYPSPPTEPMVQKDARKSERITNGEG